MMKLDPQCKLFIGGLSYETTDESLAAYFARFGEIAQAAVMRDADTGRSRGFGFVTFRTQDCAQDALRATHHTVDGRRVESKFAVPRNRPTTPSSAAVALPAVNGSAQRRESPPQQQQQHDALLLQQHDYLSHQPAHHHHHLQQQQQQQQQLYLQQQRQSMSSPFSQEFPLSAISMSSGGSGGQLTGGEIVNNKIFVGGLKYATNADMLKRFFQDMFGDVDSAQIILNRDTRKSRGFGFVIFTNPQCVDHVLSQQLVTPLMIEGKQVEVRACTARQTILPQTPILHMTSPGGNSSSNNNQQQHLYLQQQQLPEPSALMAAAAAAGGGGASNGGGFRSPWAPLGGGGGGRSAFESPPPATGAAPPGGGAFPVFRPQASYTPRPLFSPPHHQQQQNPHQHQQHQFQTLNPDLGLFDMSLVANELTSSPTLGAAAAASSMPQQSGAFAVLGGGGGGGGGVGAGPGVFRPPGLMLLQQQQQLLLQQQQQLLQQGMLFADPFSPVAADHHNHSQQQQHSLFSSPDPSSLFSSMNSSTDAGSSSTTSASSSSSSSSSMFLSPSKAPANTSLNSAGSPPTSSSPRTELARSPVMSGSLAFPSSLGTQTIW